MTTAQDQQSREAYEDGKWYWVEHEGWHGEPPAIAPACYKAECDAWYSYIFSGISTPYLKVLEPCELQAARALPAGMEPLCYLRPAAATTPARAWQAWENDGTSEPVYTAAQVLAMGRVPPQWQAVPADRTEEMKRAAMELLLDGLDIYVNGQDQIVIETDAPRRIWKAMLAAAPRPPAAPTTEPQAPTTGAGSVTAGASPAYRLLQRDIDTIQADDEFLRDDAVTWQADPQGIFVGMTYMSNVLRPARRAIEPAP